MNNIKIRVKLFTNIPANDVDHKKRASYTYLCEFMYFLNTSLKRYNAVRLAPQNPKTEPIVPPNK